MLEREARRLRNEVLLFPAHILGKCAAANAEYRITGSKLRHVPTDRLDVPRHIDSRDGVLGSAQAGSQADDERDAAHEVPVEGIDRGRSNPYEHAVVVDHRLLDLSEFEYIR